MIVKEIFKKYSPSNEGYIILLDTVKTEVKDIISRKLQSYEQYIYNQLIKAEKRIKADERELVVAKEITNSIKANPHYNSIYGYFEKKHFGFLKLISKDNHIAFIKELYKEIEGMKNYFEEITSKYPTKYMNDFIVKWIDKNKK